MEGIVRFVYYLLVLPSSLRDAAQVIHVPLAGTVFIARKGIHGRKQRRCCVQMSRGWTNSCN